MKDKTKIYSYVNLTLAMAIAGSAVVVSKLMVNNLPTFLAAELGIFIGMIILNQIIAKAENKKSRSIIKKENEDKQWTESLDKCKIITNYTY